MTFHHLPRNPRKRIRLMAAVNAMSPRLLARVNSLDNTAAKTRLARDFLGCGSSHSPAYFIADPDDHDQGVWVHGAVNAWIVAQATGGPILRERRPTGSYPLPTDKATEFIAFARFGWSS